MIGSVGSGKTMRLVEVGLDRMKRGDLVYANFHYGRRVGAGLFPCSSSHDHASAACSRPLTRWLEPMSEGQARARGLRWGKAFVADEPRYRFVSSWDDLVNVSRARDEWNNPDRRGITILIDEINLWAPSRMWGDLPLGLLFKWSHNRKQGLEIWWSSQREARVDKVIREVTELCYWSRSFGIGRPWFFWRRRYVPEPDAVDPENMKSGQLEGSFWHSEFSRFKPGMAALYDTYEAILPSSHLVTSTESRASGAPRKRGARAMSGVEPSSVAGSRDVNLERALVGRARGAPDVGPVRIAHEGGAD